MSVCKGSAVTVLVNVLSPFSNAVAELKAEAARIEHETELECQTQAREAEIKFIREQNELEISKAKELSAIEVSGDDGMT